MHNFDVEIKHEKIFYFPNALENSEEILSMIEDTEYIITQKDMISKWSEWLPSDSDNPYGKTKTIDIKKYSTSCDLIKYIYDSIQNAMDKSIFYYSEKTKEKINNYGFLSISKYYDGRFMGPHTDAAPNAHISGVMYLNDNYRGGELNFPNQNISIKPKSGSLIIFPSVEPFIHDPQPHSGAERYICPKFWFK